MTDLADTFPPKLKNWIEQQIAYGRFTDASDYLRDLVRRDQEHNLRLRDLIEEGLASGVVDEESEDVIERIIAGSASPHG